MIGPGNLLPPLHICQHLIAEWAADEEFVGNSVRVLLSTHQSAHYVAQTQEHDCCLWDRERGRKKETPGSLFSTCLCLQTANFFTKHVVEQNKAEKRWLISIWKYAVMLGSHLKMQLTERNTLYLFSLVLWQCWIIAALHMLSTFERVQRCWCRLYAGKHETIPRPLKCNNNALMEK